MLARLAGAHWLGAYTAVLNTAAAVTSPVSQVLANNATLTAAHAHREGLSQFRAHAKGHLLLGTILSLLACMLFAWLQWDVIGGGSRVTWGLMLVAGCCVASGQVIAGIVQGFYQGAGRFLTAARVTAAVAVSTGVLVLPAVWLGGVHGALMVAAIVAIVPGFLLWGGIFRGSGWNEAGGLPLVKKLEAPLPEALRRLWRACPSVGATGVNAAVNWLCTIYLVQQGHGLTGVGVVAVATQWSTLLLMPATSWGGLTLKALTDSVASGRPAEVRETIWRQILKNVRVTAIMALVLTLVSGLIAKAYGLADSDLGLLLCVNAAAATVAAANNVFERLLVCLDAQSMWFVYSLMAFAAQLAITAIFIHRGLVFVAVGVLLAGVLQGLLCSMSLRSLLKRVRL
ncbi:hypothetical protein VVD49_01605 [Uliginosibacterium sp. H3]|uniref:Membrane protein involved in the export of O-antigen and teichoic acid n=1 Tax=Uliginosibacterium silvisoli TaxID=3114758 RepID=A0ABU6JYP2_9RHOO|nr:hypothetical protein [Uliginosibacterium sp. H3]